MNNLKGCKIGDKTELKVEITESFVQEFAKFSGDTNPLHLDQAFAEKSTFKRRVAHGMSYGSIFSRLVGTNLFGAGSLWISQEFRFAKPVYIGDEVHLSVEITSLNHSTETISIECKAVNNYGEVVLTGSGEVMLLDQEENETFEPVPEQRTAIITGGSRGIGAAIAHRLSEDKFNTVITYNKSRDEAFQLCSKLENSKAIQCDASDVNAINGLIQQVNEIYGKPDTLILNAGSPDMYGDSASGDFSKFSNQLKIQLEGTHALVSACIEGMVDSGFGNIVAIGSAFTEGIPPINMSPYIVSKAALTAYVRCLAIEYGVNGIRANIVAPGITSTSLVSRMPNRARKVAAANNPMRRLGESRDIANAVAYLISEESSYVNGATLMVTGGSFI